jgi:hypothetical protein
MDTTVENSKLTLLVRRVCYVPVLERARFGGLIENLYGGRTRAG